MPLQQSVVSSPSNRVAALRAKHKHLSDTIEQELSRPFFSEEKVTQLKRKKLILKEKIEGIRA